MTVQQRVDDNLALALPAVMEKNPDRRLACRYLFSALCDLEKIAVTAALRGDAIPGQLDDELVHRDTFAALAENFGGKIPTLPSIGALIEFVDSLRGPLSLAVLNVVAEGWLASVFKRVGTWGVADAMFASIGAEEQRHSTEALRLAKPDPEDAKPQIRELERLLWGVATDLYFVVPLAHLGGAWETAQIGRDNADVHEQACRALGIEASPLVHEIGNCGLEAQELECPAQVQPNAWQRSAFNLRVGPIWSTTRVNVPAAGDDAMLEARIVRAAARVLRERPYLNRTISVARREIYNPETPVIGVRRLYDRKALITTIYTKIGDVGSANDVRVDLRNTMMRVRRAPYRETPELDPIARIMPAPQCALIVTHTAPFGLRAGHPALVETEGATISIATGRDEDGKLVLGTVVDHRVHNGWELAEIESGIREELEKNDDG